MLPIVAVQVAHEESPTAFEQRMLDACSAALQQARCVMAAEAAAEKQRPRAVAMVSWSGDREVSVEVGVAGAAPPVWRTRELAFRDDDPDLERWRAVGFTIALLADDERLWAHPAASSTERSSLGVGGEARALAGAGLVEGPWRLGAELRFSLLLPSALFATAAAHYAGASSDEVQVRWFDVSAGIGLRDPALLEDVEGRVRLELLLENIAAEQRRGTERDGRSAWAPGALVGVDIGLWLARDWLLSARCDAFWLDGSTAVTSAGEVVAVSAGAGVLLGAGAGYRF